MLKIVECVTQITLGRATKDKQIDVDLSLEGPAWKISRKQGKLSHLLNVYLLPNCIKIIIVVY